MQYPIIDLITSAYINNGWTGLDIPETITFEPIQLGSGEPSPTNVRPILPATVLNIGGNDVPVYGGSLDVTTGVLTVDRAYNNVSLDNFAYMTTINCIVGFAAYNILPGAKVPANNTTKINAMADSININSASAINGGADGLGLTVSKDVYFRSSGLTSKDEYLLMFPNGVNVAYELATPITYQCTNEDINYLLSEYSARILKLPLPHYFPHPVIDALQRAAAGTQTADDTEILRHYLTPLGIGGI